MRVDTVIAALRPLVTGHHSEHHLTFAKELIDEFDKLSVSPELDETEPVVITFGAKEGMVVFQTQGNELCEPTFFVWSIDDANEVIEGIRKAIVLAEEQWKQFEGCK